MRKKKYSAELIIRIVKERIENETSWERLAAKYNIHHRRIQEWVIQYEENGESAFIQEEHNRVYSEETKVQAVEEYLNGKGSQQEVAAKYGLRDRKQLREWIKVYNSGRGFRHRMSGGSRMKEARPTTVEERIQIAKDCIANGGNYGDTALKFNVSYQQVYQWVKKYREMGDAGLEDRRGKRKKDQEPRSELEAAQIEIEKLKHQLYLAEMERDLLEKLDEIERRDASQE